MRTCFSVFADLHIISRKKLRDTEHRQSTKQLDSWYKIAQSAKWRDLEGVRNTYPSADGIPFGERTYTVFNIAGNSFRLVTEIYYKDQVILIRHVLTHAEYTKGDWKK
jgi:mRNA interferase HigB